MEAAAGQLGDRELVLGIRPEHLQPVDAGPAALVPLVETVEPVGNEVFVNLRLGDAMLVARFPPSLLPAPGQVQPLAVTPGRALLFDADSGQRLAA